MKKLKTPAIAFALMLGLAYPLASSAADGATSQNSSKPSATDKPAGQAKPGSGKPAVTSSATSAAAAQAKGTTPAASNNGGEKPADTAQAASDKNEKRGHKVAHKHKRKHDENTETMGDGKSLNKIGTHKNVDSGFDFDNSKSFHQMGK